MGTRREPGEPRRVRNVNPALAAPFHNDVSNRPSDDRDGSQADGELGRQFYRISLMSHGYFKLRRDFDSFDVHLTYTWTSTRHSGSYVYVRVDAEQLGPGLQMLARKIQEVDEGSRNPTPDKRRTT